MTTKAISVRAYARHRKDAGLEGGTHRAVQVAIESGRLVTSVTRDKRIRSAKTADAEWLAATNADRVPLTGPTSVPAPVVQASAPSAPHTNALADVRARRETAQAELREMELAEKRGELVPAHDVEAQLVAVFARCRTRLLAIPVRVRQRDASFTPAQLALLEQVIRDALEDLATPTTEPDAIARS